MTKHNKPIKSQKQNAVTMQQTGNRTVTEFQGVSSLLMEDFSRTIRSFCARVVSPPIDFLDVARRTRWRGQPPQTTNEIQEILAGNETMKNETTKIETHTQTHSTLRGGNIMNTRNETIFKSLTRNKLAVSVIALGTAFGAVTPAFATIDNTVTVSGTAPGGTAGAVQDTSTENVDVIDAIDSLAITKVADQTVNVLVGTLVTYTYTATNTGNRTLTNVSMADTAHEGTGSVSTVAFVASPLTDNGTTGDSTDDSADNVWDTLAPGDVVTWQATYTITQADLNSNGGDGDGELTNTGTTTATAPGGVAGAVTATVDESVDLEDQNPSLQVAKLGYTGGAGGTLMNGTTDNLAVGTVITYEYVITNNGNVPISAVSLADVHNGSGTAPAPDADAAVLTDNGTLLDSSNPTGSDGAYDTLAPGDVLTVTSTYTVTQSDVDNLQ